MYEIKYHREVFKDLDKVPDDIVKRVAGIIKELSSNPFPANCKKISGKLNAYRLKMGDYRVIYTVSHQENQIKIFRVRHRKDVYRNLKILF